MAPEADFVDFIALGKELLVTLEAKRSRAPTLTIWRHVQVLPWGGCSWAPVPPWAPSLAHMDGHSPRAALTHGWGKLSLNFLMPGGRRKGYFNQPLWFSAMNKHSALPRKGSEGCDIFHSTEGQAAAQSELWCLLHSSTHSAAEKTHPFQAKNMPGWRGGTAPGADRMGQRSAIWAIVPERRLCHCPWWKHQGKTNSLAETSCWHPNKQDLD